jgi:hypothetical protein
MCGNVMCNKVYGRHLEGRIAHFIPTKRDSKQQIMCQNIRKNSYKYTAIKPRSAVIFQDVKYNNNF